MSRLRTRGPLRFRPGVHSAPIGPNRRVDHAAPGRRIAPGRNGSGGLRAVASLVHRRTRLHASTTRRIAATALAVLGLLSTASAASADAPDLENLSAAQAEKLLQSGDISSVQLPRAYLSRIAAINKAGPGLNAVTQ